MYFGPRTRVALPGGKVWAAYCGSSPSKEKVLRAFELTKGNPGMSVADWPAFVEAIGIGSFSTEVK